MARRPSAFHRKHGQNIRLYEENTVARRVGSYAEAVVFSEQPIPTGATFQVKLLDKGGGWKGSIKFGFSVSCPDDHPVPRRETDLYGSSEYWILSESTVHHSGQEGRVDFNLQSLRVGQSVGCLVNREGELHYFIDGEDQGVGWTGVPTDRPMWGVADIYGLARKIKSEFSCVEEQGKESSNDDKMTMCAKGDHKWGHEVWMICKFCTGYGPGCNLEGLPGREPGRECGCGSGDSGCSKCGCCRTCAEVREEPRQHNTDVRQLELSLLQTRQELSRERAQHLQENEAQIQEKDVRIQQLQQQLADIRREKDALQQTLSRTHSQEIEFWRVSPEEVLVDQDLLGDGAWGYVVKGKFRGQMVAVKRVHRSILQPTIVDRIRREISTMAQVRHPNLVLFIAAVLDDRTGPMIITEILDGSLRTVYEDNRLGSNKLRVLRDVASALNYLHLHRQPIIHRDVSSANVLLEAVASDVWKAKLSDFGSANLVRFATTPGEGAIIYTAPEAFPQHPRSRTPPPPQTPKIDVYSYGVLVGEVVILELPDPDRLQEMVQQVWRQWPQIHPLVTSSIEYSPNDRPTMAYILEELEKLTP